MRTFLCALLLAGFCLTSRAADLSAADQQFLAQYEKIRAGLAADNLAEAKKAAVEMGAAGAPLTQTDSLILGRREFEKLSARAIALTKDQPGYFVVNCPMLQKEWVQTSTKISNPYAGASMLSCGTFKK